MIHRAQAGLERGCTFLITAALLVGFASVMLSVLAEQLLGLRIPVALVAVVLVVLGAWTASTTKPKPAPPPVAAPPAPRPRTRAEVEALIALHREGEITSAELRDALGDLVPQRPATPPPTGGQQRGARR